MRTIIIFCLALGLMACEDTVHPAQPIAESGYVAINNTRQYVQLNAPKKAFILFEKSGCDPAWEEAERFINELIRIYKLINKSSKKLK